MMDVHYIYCGHHFMMYVSQIIMLYTLNLYSVVFQLYLNKTGRKKRNRAIHVTYFFLKLGNLCCSRNLSVSSKLSNSLA